MTPSPAAYAEARALLAELRAALPPGGGLAGRGGGWVSIMSVAEIRPGSVASRRAEVAAEAEVEWGGS